MKPQPDDQRLVGEMEVAKFDQDYIGDDVLDEIVSTLLAVKPDIVKIADFGGGNGRFLDRLLQRIPRANGTNYETSIQLRAVNAHHPRKAICGQSFLVVEDWAEHDLILMNWVLHHLVGDTLHRTVQLVHAASDIAYRALKPGGILVISENLLQSLFPEQFSSAILYYITQSQLLKPLTSRMKDGTSVAGVGIYYMSAPQLLRIFSGFELLATFDRNRHDYGKRLMLIGITSVLERILIFRKPFSSPDRCDPSGQAL